MKIETELYMPPIPLRNYDWAAWDGETYEPGCPVGYGASKQEAIEDLLDQLEG